jgi:TRAP-type mannitol/chloroaromatic compound transport system permease small subunit
MSDPASPISPPPFVAPKLLRWAEDAVRCLCRIAAWIALLLILVIAVTVFLRYAVKVSYNWLDELRIWLHGSLFLFGFTYAALDDAHVRVDILSGRFSPKWRRMIECASLLLLQIPFLFLVVWVGWDYTATAYNIDEGSENPGGLPNLWLLKGLMIGAISLWCSVSLLRFILICAGKPVSDEKK